MFTSSPPKSFAHSNWNFENNLGPQHILFLAEDIKDQPTKIVDQVIFRECDFQGVFNTKLVFKNCKFILCDLGLSTFKRAKFTGCTFDRSSFTQCTLDNCEFRNCQYKNIFFSGNETQIPATLIAEPWQFVFSARTNTKHLPKGKSKFEQNLRFAETRSTLARSILANLNSEGSEDTYYNAVKAVAISEDLARVARSIIKIKLAASSGWSLKNIFSLFIGLMSTVSSAFGIIILFIMGFLNAWGLGVSRAVTLGGLFIFLMAYEYHNKFGMHYGCALIKSSEIFFLFGYTNYAKMGAVDFHLVFINALLGLFWYAVSIPTITSRLTRTRG